MFLEVVMMIERVRSMRPVMVMMIVRELKGVVHDRSHQMLIRGQHKASPLERKIRHIEINL
jgi:hypothetical protein